MENAKRQRTSNAERLEAAFYSGRQTADPVKAPESVVQESSSEGDKELLLKLLANPEMAALLKTLAKSL